MKYYSETILSFSVLIDGKRKRVAFTPLTNGGSVYLTDNKKEIEVLEKLGAFGKTFVRSNNPAYANVGNESDAKDNPEGGITVVDHVTSYQQAIDYLVKHKLAKKTTLTNPDAILAAASAARVSFPNITV